MPQPHPLQTLSSTTVALDPSNPDPYPIKDTGPISPPLAYLGVCVDNLIKVFQVWFYALRDQQSNFHNIDAVFQPNDSLDTNTKQPIS